MRVAIIAESFLPYVNGVSNSVLRILDYASRHGHECIVIAPGSAHDISNVGTTPIIRVPQIRVPRINSLPVGAPSPKVLSALREFQPDVVHLASPFVLGGAGAWAAKHLDVPCVAVFQTDIAGFSLRYRLSWLYQASWRWIATLHNACSLTLAPSSVAEQELRRAGVHDIQRWGRGVDVALFHPKKRRRQKAQDQPIRVGYVGRLAAEKSVHRLACLDQDPAFELVIIGDGPERGALQRAMPNAEFLGARYGEELAQEMANLDIFVHTGEFETFCQTIQEAHASGVPTIAPRAGGPIDLIDPSVGELLPVASFEQELPGAVRRLAKQHDAMSKAARAKVEPRTWDAVCQALFEHYAQVRACFVA
ncbi:glycosyltransferase family 4 protein [Corynebacterium pelargi]|uniref:GDP-mannose-dependent alpha-mannosyltransferase n=1 Tax=Corynebacterium pelargi TaxID=1471400 RepID=A0A410WB58_9CORY|nr:glycosyltransferase family 1 protein [Corynebacterium pelargi]QAU53208.1 GDP-mannose-dependent alpha-mannosyltransferase [Corynebacterium pelargi]GGG74069.1 GDP-mannose-dependent alpha-mannosyltransferase [Corynebacterium pelargi]